MANQLSIDITVADTRQPKFTKWLMNRHRTVVEEDKKTKKLVSKILDSIDRKGDSMVLKYAKKFDKVRKVNRVTQLAIPMEERMMALDRLSEEHRKSLEFAFGRISDFHKRQMDNMGKNWEHYDDDGFVTGCSKIPYQRVGLYIPGGGAVYASTVLMCAIPARMAGVEELTMTTPAYKHEHNDLLLAASALANIEHVYSLGGVQAIGAMAYGTDTIAPVNKIVGPGNRFVSLAKSMVRDRVGIDTIAGPSEILIITDGTANPEWVALDLFAQAEHDADARATIISPDSNFLKRVMEQMHQLLPSMERRRIITKALNKHGLFLEVQDITEAVKISNYMAPEHLCLMVEDPESLLVDVQHAGAIFLGERAAQVYGDYCAGPSHVLPTGGRARFDSALNVSSFYRYSTIVGGAPLNDQCYEMTAVLARAEGLEAHARAVEARLHSKPQDENGQPNNNSA